VSQLGGKCTLLVILCLLLWGCSDSDPGAGLCDNACEARQLTASLSSVHSPANESLLLALLENELGSESFYLVEYWRLDSDNLEADELLSQYDAVLTSQLELVGARMAVDNAVFNQPTQFEERDWNRVRVIYYPSPQALLDVLQAPGYQQAIQLKHRATTALQSLWVKALFAVPVVDTFPEREEFYMSNLSTTREIALYPDGTSHGLTGAEANKLYTDVVTGPLWDMIGAFLAMAGTVEHLVFGTDDEWEIFALVYYPSLPDLITMITDPRFQEAFPNKGAGLARNSSMMTAPLIDPELP
jgi:uncharacterized protein (DUF1330 family)